jgi:glucose-6-phosphate 1-epimerase
VIEGERHTEVYMSGFRDAVIWNPGAKLGGTIKDLQPGGYLSMLCVEAAAIGHPVVLAGGEKWSGAQELRALSS